MVIEPDVLTGGCDPSSCWSNPGSDGDLIDIIIACPAPRPIIGDSGAAKDILGKNDLSFDCVINTALDVFFTATLLDKCIGNDAPTRAGHSSGQHGASRS
eukprot:16442405-Heterocapsa_arctica.AAC.1